MKHRKRKEYLDALKQVREEILNSTLFIMWYHRIHSEIYKKTDLPNVTIGKLHDAVLITSIKSIRSLNTFYKDTRSPHEQDDIRADEYGWDSKTKGQYLEGNDIQRINKLLMHIDWSRISSHQFWNFNDYFEKSFQRSLEFIEYLNSQYFKAKEYQELNFDLIQELLRQCLDVIKNIPKDPPKGKLTWKPVYYEDKKKRDSYLRKRRIKHGILYASVFLIGLIVGLNL